MKKLFWLISKAEKSSFYLWLLNVLALRVVPYNKPHGFRITKVSSNSIEVHLPYKKVNLNHIKGIHACALATLSEYCTGSVLLSSIDPALYRIILKNIHMTYHYQAKTSVSAKFELDKVWIENNILNPLKTNEAVFSELKVEVYDNLNNHISTGLINWQIKSWNKVRTK